MYYSAGEEQAGVLPKRCTYDKFVTKATLCTFADKVQS